MTNQETRFARLTTKIFEVIKARRRLNEKAPGKSICLLLLVPMSNARHEKTAADF
jgi:hypothetical protein